MYSQYNLRINVSFRRSSTFVNLIHSCLKRLIGTSASVLCTRFVHWTKPLTSSLPLGTLADLTRSKPELMAENALLRQQLIILKRQVKRPICTKADRILLVLEAQDGSGLETSALYRPASNTPAASIVKHIVGFGGAGQWSVLLT